MTNMAWCVDVVPSGGVDACWRYLASTLMQWCATKPTGHPVPDPMRVGLLSDEAQELIETTAAAAAAADPEAEGADCASSLRQQRARAALEQEMIDREEVLRGTLLDHMENMNRQTIALLRDISFCSDNPGQLRSLARLFVSMTQTLRQVNRVDRVCVTMFCDRLMRDLAMEEPAPAPRRPRHLFRRRGPRKVDAMWQCRARRWIRHTLEELAQEDAHAGTIRTTLQMLAGNGDEDEAAAERHRSLVNDLMSLGIAVRQRHGGEELPAREAVMGRRGGGVYRLGFASPATPASAVRVTGSVLMDGGVGGGGSSSSSSRGWEVGPPPAVAESGSVLMDDGVAMDWEGSRSHVVSPADAELIFDGSMTVADVAAGDGAAEAAVSGDSEVV